MKPWLKLFLSGFLTHSASISLTQDMYGKEKYIQIVNTNWVDASITVPLAIIMCIGAYALLHQGRKGL